MSYNEIRLQLCSLPSLSSGRFWLSFQSIVVPLPLSLLACCRSLWSAPALLKGLAERKEKVTKESVCICYSLPGVVLSLETPRDGFLVNVNRAGATGWFLRHAQKAFSRGYSHLFHLQTVKCVLYYIVQMCVCVHSFVSEGSHAKLNLFRQGKVWWRYNHQCRKERGYSVHSPSRTF